MITTPSGKYTLEQYEEIENKVKKAYKDFWNKKITMEEHRKIIEKSGLSYGEIKSIQYQASIEK